MPSTVHRLLSRRMGTPLAALAAACGAQLLAPPAGAQVAAAQPGASDQSVQEVVVTGSRIHRDVSDTTTNAPLTVVGSDVLPDRGYTQVGEALNQLTANVPQFALTPHPDLKDVPTAVSLARNDEERQIVSTIVAAADIGLAFFTTPGVPADRLTALRRAFDATMKDKDFLDEVEKLKLTASPMKGEDLQQLIKQVSSLSPAMLEKVRHAYTANQAKE